uniref:Sucrose nonfermenting 4-like protein n=1 Tax=Rhizophora mucronata TaxID=61149 RepID=A0A2P2L3B0_RHIMU
MSNKQDITKMTANLATIVSWHQIKCMGSNLVTKKIREFQAWDLFPNFTAQPMDLQRKGESYLQPMVAPIVQVMSLGASMC